MALKEFEGCAICQFNLYIKVKAEDAKEAEEKIDEVLDKSFPKDFFIGTPDGQKIQFNYDECFEILDVGEVK